MAALESAGVAAGLITAHVGLSNPHTQYLLASGYTAADLISKLLTVDGSGSGLDADLLDGLSSAAFEAVGTAAGLITAHVAAANPHSQYTLASSFTTHQALTTAHGISAYGATLVDDADATAARTTLGLGTMATQAANGYAALATANTFTLAQTIDHATPNTGVSTTKLLLSDAASNSELRINHIRQTDIDLDYYTFSTVSDVPQNANLVLGFGNQYGQAGFFINRSIQFTTSLVEIRQVSSTNLSVFTDRTIKILSATGLGTHFIFSQAAGLELKTIYEAATFFSANQSVGVVVSAPAAALKPLVVRGIASQSANLQEWQDSSSNILASVSATGVITISPRSSITNTIQNTITAGHNTSGTPAAGFGVATRAQLESSTTENQDAGRLTWEWDVATHAVRASKGQLTAFFTSTEHKPVTWGANSGGALLSFYDITTPIARQVLATGAGRTVDDVITTLQALGLVKQS